MKYGDLFQTAKMKSPTATSYHPEHHYNTRAFSLGKRFEIDTEKWAREVPGPGNYARLDLTNSKNQKNVSKYLTAPASKFSLDTRKSLANRTFAPGPGKCTLFLITQDNPPSDFDESLFDKAYTSKFGGGKRN